MLRRILILIPVFCLAAVVLYFGSRYYLLGRFTIPKSPEYVEHAKPWIPVVQAIADFRVDHGGLYPDDLARLAPDYIHVLPRNGFPSLSGDYFSVAAGMPHTGIIYSFNQADEGWSVRGDFGVGNLPLPKIVAAHPDLIGDARSRARLDELRLRASKDPKSLPLRVAVYNELMAQSKTEDLMLLAEEQVQQYPDWWRPRLVTAWLAPPGQRQQCEMRFRDWVTVHPNFLYYWYLARYYIERHDNDAAVDALQEAVKFPLKRIDEDADYPASTYGHEAARFAYEQRRYDLVLAIIRRWASPVDFQGSIGDDWLPYKAAAELALSHFPDAKADATRIAELIPPAPAAGAPIAPPFLGNYQDLLKAINDRDPTFIYIPGPLPMAWSLFSGPS